MRHSNELLEHLLSDRKVGNDAILHWSNSADIAWNAAEHLLSCFTDGMDSCFPVLSAFLTNGDDARFIEHDAFSAHVNERIGGTEVDGEIVGKVIAEKAKHDDVLRTTEDGSAGVYAERTS